MKFKQLNFNAEFYLNIKNSIFNKDNIQTAILLKLNSRKEFQIKLISRIKLK